VRMLSLFAIPQQTGIWRDCVILLLSLKLRRSTRVAKSMASGSKHVCKRTSCDVGLNDFGSLLRTDIGAVSLTDTGAVSLKPGIAPSRARTVNSTIEPTRDAPVLIRVSVIVPAYNNPGELSQCVTALRAAATSDTELIVVDDASEDDVSSAAANFGAQVLRLARNAGPAAARNHGARHARGQTLFFVDADVVVPNDAIGRIRATLDGHSEIAAVFGSYDSRPAAPGLVSQYRNLLHHFVHQTGNAEAATFWAGCGAVRRQAFEHVGGFDEQRFPRPSIEDIELGYRLRRAGYRICIDKSLQSMHLKRWTLRSIVRTDVICRAIPWSRLILESAEAPDYLNVQASQRASVALTGLGSLLLLTSPLHLMLLTLTFACMAAVVFINRDLYTFFYRARGTFFAAACVPLHLLYFVCCGVGYQCAWALSMLQRRRAARVVWPTQAKGEAFRRRVRRPGLNVSQ
jgi:glycosyltransferase involved in cell wall biosynthesis